MHNGQKEMAIINLMLGEEGVMKYNAIKNRFIAENAEDTPQQPNLLHMYREDLMEVPSTTISTYKTNLQRLRRKIEECKIRITEVKTPLNQNSLSSVAESVKTERVRTEETIVVVSPNGTKTPLAQAHAPVPPQNQHITTIGTIEQFTNSTVYGYSTVVESGKKKEGTIKLEQNILQISAPTKNGEIEVLAKVDLSSSKLFVISQRKRRVFFCFKKSSKYIPLDKEIDIINITKDKTHELILKNTNTGSFTKNSLSTLSFCLKDSYNQMHDFEIENSNEFIRWLLILKMRMHPVDLWTKNELFDSIQKRHSPY